MAGNRGRGFPPPCPDHSGEGAGQNRFNVPQPQPRTRKKAPLFAFANRRDSWSLRRDGTDRNCVAVQSAGYGGLLAGLLVQRRQGCFV